MSTATESVAASFQALREHADRIRNDQHQTVATMSPGDAWAQGDVLLVCLKNPPKNLEQVKNPALQLAPGETQGSRHCLESLAGVKVWRRRNDRNPLDGPILEAPAGVRVNHPEHGDVSLPPGWYEVLYQRALSDEAELRRAID